MPQKINGNDVYTVTVSVQDIANRFTPITRTFTLTIEPCATFTTTTTTTTILSVPSAPLNLIGTAHPSYFSLDWNAPVSNGGTAITAYIIQYSIDGGISWDTYDSGASTQPPSTEFNVVLNYSYVCFRIIAKNSVGNSSPSNMVCIQGHGG
jgi:hypothetical protein